MKVEKIYVYPVKALRAVEVNDSIVTKHGFPYDRRFMLVHVDRDKDGSTIYKNIHVAHYPESIFFHPSLDTKADLIRIDFKPPEGRGEKQTLDFPLKPVTEDLEIIPIKMHLSEVHAYKMPQQYSDWFTSCYGFEVALVYLGPNYRPTRMSQTPIASKQPSGWLSSITSTASSYLPFGSKELSKELLTFNDCAPYLVCSSKSMEDVAARISSDKENLDIIKFRPNIIVSGAEKAWDEDFWSQITITSSSNSSSSQTRIECIHNCGRCKSINIDYTTGKPGEKESGEVLKKLQRDRRVDVGMKYSPIFGRYSFLNDDSEGNLINVGDEVVVSRRNGEHTKFGEFSFTGIERDD
ncbi:Molybdenum cofactor sulfurase [Pseudocercospora fuligena]|uniref:Molybdenum cofactor sulfurase n=1 Tax=Pseudocercospora fuligena TaxID=685502 RepID=A0A8H6RGU7_9PEZI|nr:Molybdenum cofactor sulfurase [Pseudocercospora fuligena]